MLATKNQVSEIIRYRFDSETAIDERMIEDYFEKPLNGHGIFHSMTRKQVQLCLLQLCEEGFLRMDGFKFFRRTA
ncbi:MAG: hypothetical protein WBA09_22520 [Candidatus Acidiferrum sp.]